MTGFNDIPTATTTSKITLAEQHARSQALRNFGTFIAFLAISAAFVWLVYFNSSERQSECERRGERYFRDIGSFPTLSDGRNALEVARARCSRSEWAFGVPR